MPCTQTQPHLDAYADGELSPVAAFRIRRHLAACPACAAELADIRQLHRRAQAWRDQPAPVDLRDRIAATLPPATSVPTLPRNRRVVRRVAIGIAGVAAALGAGFWLLPGHPSQPAIALADVEQAMASVNIMTYVDNTYQMSRKASKHSASQVWVRRSPPAFSVTDLLPGSETSLSTTLFDERGMTAFLPDGRYILSGAGKNIARSVEAQFKFWDQPLSYAATTEQDSWNAVAATKIEQTSLDGKPALKFAQVWHSDAHRFNASGLSRSVPTREAKTTIWVDPKTNRVVHAAGEVTQGGKLVLRSVEMNFRYNIAPPAGTFDILPPPGANVADLRPGTNNIVPPKWDKKKGKR